MCQTGIYCRPYFTYCVYPVIARSHNDFDHDDCDFVRSHAIYELLSVTLVIIHMSYLSVSFGLVVADGVVCPRTTSVCFVPFVIDHKFLGVSILWLQLWQLSTWAIAVRFDP
jgi:hypothetical protein